MIELLIAVSIGVLIGFLIRNEQRPPIIDELYQQIKKLEDDVRYYKKLTKGLVEENAQLREELRRKE